LNVAVKSPKLSSVESISRGASEIDEELLSLSARIDEFEAYTSAHGRRIASIADALASHFNLASRDRIFLQQAALIHDIGEMSMNREYIGSSRVLSANERFDLERHPVIGEQDAAKLGLPRAVQLIIRWHHEWWNGTGYPDCLQNEQIPLAARLLRISDTYAALTAARPYRQAMSVDEAKRHLIEWAGIEFDPTVVKTFLTVSNAARAPQPTQVPVETSVDNVQPH
jgi:HD-GYP domain-containing protein (c-di-GMP phosphodiesterase class II)